jgi:hypothetical protein
MNTVDEKFERIARVRKVVMMHPQFKSAYDTLVEAYRLNDQVGIAQHYLLTGEAGTGKSTIKTALLQTFPPQWLEDRRQVPVLAIDTPSLPTVKNLAEEFLMQLGDPRYGRGSAIEKTGRILRYLEGCDVKLIIIDELQHFIDQGNQKAPREVADWLKSLIERANVATVLMGLGRSQKILEINEQLRRRFCSRLELRPFGFDSPEERAQFVGVLKRLDECFGLPIPMDIQKPEMAQALHYATNGIMDYMVKLLIGAYEVVRRNDRQTIDMDSLAHAFKSRIWTNATDELNPFNKRFIQQRLDKRGMPFSKFEYIQYQ